MSFGRLLKFKRREDGSATIEFVFLFPLFMSIFLMGFESGYYMVRGVMLERGLDIATREVRLGNGRVPQLAAFKELVCMNMVVLPDCRDELQIEMKTIPIAPGGTDEVAGAFKCIDKSVDEDQSVYSTYDTGGTNQLVVVRACAVTSPMFPTTGLGLGMTRPETIGQNYALVATNVFVTEPGSRAMSPYVPGAPLGMAPGGTNP
ncbi:MAG: TadE/TadG family type IV pilus assembly protein [Paracoccaceae bacterium]|nr:TadE/TadG family type IV pilus assembly protein [Paracoccaceae bacterium]